MCSEMCHGMKRNPASPALALSFTSSLVPTKYMYKICGKLVDSRNAGIVEHKFKCKYA